MHILFNLQIKEQFEKSSKTNAFQMITSIKMNEDLSYSETESISGSEALIRTLINENVDIVFGYPGGAIMPIYDALFDHQSKLRHILTRHEQGAIHAAQAYAEVTKKPGVVFVTSGPGATNVVTGLADAYADSIPVVCISGQVGAKLLGTDAFQEADIIGVTIPVTKWNYRITNVDEIPFILSKALFIANTGRPGPVMIDITKDAQIETANYSVLKCKSVKGYEPFKNLNEEHILQACKLINSARKPLIIFGHGVTISKAQNELLEFVNKSGIPSAWTILGVSALPSKHKLNIGMMGMHGNFVPNKMAQECDVLIAIGMRFDDRVTGDTECFAPSAKIIHIDIDPSEINKVVKADCGIIGDIKQILPVLTNNILEGDFTSWIKLFENYLNHENKVVLENELKPENDDIQMAQVIKELNEITNGNAILTTDVGQHQMITSRYVDVSDIGTMITSGGQGTMGFGLPAAIGAKIGDPEKNVIAIVGDGGIQMTIQELGTIMQEKLDVKIIIMNNQFLGMVRQWQELFFDKRYSFTEMINPDFIGIANAYNIPGSVVENIDDLKSGIEKMFYCKGAYLLEVKIAPEGNVFPIIPSGQSVNEIKFKP